MDKLPKEVEEVSKQIVIIGKAKKGRSGLLVDWINSSKENKREFGYLIPSDLIK